MASNANPRVAKPLKRVCSSIPNVRFFISKDSLDPLRLGRPSNRRLRHRELLATLEALLSVFDIPGALDDGQDVEEHRFERDLGQDIGMLLTKWSRLFTILRTDKY